jgi:hypothetical protein
MGSQPSVCCKMWVKDSKFLFVIVVAYAQTIIIYFVYLFRLNLSLNAVTIYLNIWS